MPLSSLLASASRRQLSTFGVQLHVAHAAQSAPISWGASFMLGLLLKRENAAATVRAARKAASYFSLGLLLVGRAPAAIVVVVIVVVVVVVVGVVVVIK